MLEYVDIWKRKKRKEKASVLKIFQSTFNDVEEPMSDSDSEEDDFEESSDKWVDKIND